MENFLNKNVGGDAHIDPKKNAGITLVALVVTIVVLLILAGVSINLVAGSNGILGKAQNAVSKSQAAQMEEEIQLKLAEVMMDYYIDGNGQSLQDYIIDQCNKSEDGIFSVGDGMFSTVDGELSYTDSKGNTSVISVSNSGEVTIEGSVSAGGTVNDDKAPSVSATSTTNSITFVAKDILAGVAGWNYSTTNSEPSNWNEVNPAQKSFTHTIENLANNTTYYIWAKDANGNVSSAREINTKNFDEFAYEVSWNGANATITVNAPKTGVQYLDASKNWAAYTGPLTVEAGTVLFFRVSDGYNNIEFESVKPVLSYTISYNANGGSGTMASSQHEYGTAKNLSTNTFTRAGYDFLGWATSSSGTKVYENGQSVTNLSSDNGATVTLYAVWAPWVKATSAISASNYGQVANYSANGVTDWKVFLNDGTYIYLIASDYVPNSGVTSALSKSGSYAVYGSSQSQLVSALTTTSNWSAYANGFSGATATGGPTLAQFVKSYNQKMGTSYSDNEGQSDGFISNISDVLYNPHAGSSWNGVYSYWLASPYASNSNWSMLCSSSKLYSDRYNYTGTGVRPLVCLPSGAKASWNGTAWDLSE